MSVLEYLLNSSLSFSFPLLWPLPPSRSLRNHHCLPIMPHASAWQWLGATVLNPSKRAPIWNEIWSKSLKLSKLQFPPPYNGDKTMYGTRLSWGFSEMMNEKCLAQCQAHTEEKYCCSQEAWPSFNHTGQPTSPWTSPWTRIPAGHGL